MAELTCRSCGHEWKYTGRLNDYTSCPSCSSSVRIPESSEDDFKTDGLDNEVTELKERVESLEKEVRRLRKRRRQDNENRGSTAHADETTDDDESDLFYDPTSEF